MHRFLLGLLLVCSLVQAEPIRTDGEGHPLLDQFSEAGFVDCVFRIDDLVETATHYTFHAVGAYNGQTVGMNVAIVKGIQAAFVPGMKLASDRVYRKGVVFSRSGPDLRN